MICNQGALLVRVGDGAAILISNEGALYCEMVTALL